MTIGKHLLVMTAAIAAATAGMVMADDAKSETPAHATVVSADAQKVLDEVSEAYGKLKSLQLVGSFVGDIEANGQKKGGSIAFTDSFKAPNQFRHSAEGDCLLVSTGQKAYFYIPQKNAFAEQDAPKEKVDSKDLPRGFAKVIGEQDLSLKLAIAKDPARELTENAAEVAKLDDVKLGDAKCPTLKLSLKDKSSLIVSFDPATHLIRQSVMDVHAPLEALGIPDVKKATYTIDYTSSTPNGETNADQFAWAAPQGAKDIKDDDENAEINSTVGKPAPAFKLPTLDGKEVSLADLKGKVVILDYWATWCGPCKMSLPHLDKYYQEKKKSGLMVFAVNGDDEKGDVQAFVEKTKLGIPVLLDAGGAVEKTFKVHALPTTIVIGKDGKIAKIFIGYSPETSGEQLSAAVDEAQKAN